MLLDNIRLARGVFQAMKPPQAPFASGLPERELLGDFNNDGILDRLLVGPTLALERGNADGTFADATGGSGLPQTARAATWADVDRDGNLDAVLIVGQDYAVRVLLGD
ncbi:MAG: VCBS repeat-containing protein, partial [Planctomycetes bacterium]|nr:VCBS repeat-containing protein [Planctomycetota bacterium]